MLEQQIKNTLKEPLKKIGWYISWYSSDVDESDNFQKCRWCGSEDTRGDIKLFLIDKKIL